MIKKLLCVVLAGAFYFVFFSSCSGIFNTSSFFSSLPDVDGSPTIPSDRFFYVKVSDASYRGRSGWDWLDYVMYEREGGPGTDCKIEKTSDSTEDMYCMLDVLEGDLYFHDIILEYNVPSQMCAYLLFQTHWHYNHPTSYGPRRVDHIKVQVGEESQDRYCLSESRTTCQEKVEDLCLTNSSEVTGGANCCIGEYSLRDCQSVPCQGAKDARWGGDLRQCVGGLGRTGWEYYSEDGIPIPYIRSSVQGIRDRYTLPALVESNVNLRSTFVTANYFEGMEENDDLQELELPRIYQAYPSCSTSCRLNASSLTSGCVSVCNSVESGCESRCTQIRDSEEDNCRSGPCLQKLCSTGGDGIVGAREKCDTSCEESYGLGETPLSDCEDRCEREHRKCNSNFQDAQAVCEVEHGSGASVCGSPYLTNQCANNLDACKDACESVETVCKEVCVSAEGECSKVGPPAGTCDSAEALCKRRCASSNFDLSYRPPDQGWDMEGTCIRGLCEPPKNYGCSLHETACKNCETTCDNSGGTSEEIAECKEECLDDPTCEENYNSDNCFNQDSQTGVTTTIENIELAFNRCEYYCENTIQKTCNDVCEGFRSNCCGSDCTTNADASEVTCTNQCGNDSDTCKARCTADNYCDTVCADQARSFAGSTVSLDDLSYPYITWTCQDEGRELKHRIHLIIREWNTREEFQEFKESGGVSGDADVTGEGDTCGREGESRCNDMYDVDDFINTDSWLRRPLMPGSMCRLAGGQSPCVKYGN